ncbi:prolyl-tRNA synthetase [Amycolatopsis pretoriensis]|uniref:Proline--tRNA ligase n=1 Tax=Amycolatopsis pretoriensis TaxID=218821 RepID=A0A1H5QDL4_9PSEU|nr:proline--tRNA ligase [Amycolatopsis pretoriensis]SEF23498.1 prolyl-tRNA synthetase [Amycolatopsis pretoriensis]
MRWTRLHVPTLRHDSADVTSPSHRLLLRGGFIRQLMAGHYSLLPLAVRVRSKIVEVIRQEMNRIGAQEFLLPGMHPAEIWRRSGRWEIMGQEMFRLTDRRGADLALGMTHEEIFTLLAAEISTYKALPQAWYQFQTKFRDEPRPKAGLLRTREFTMKDSYSFDLTDAGLDESFERHRGAYQRIFTRLGISAIPVDASSGSMGGSNSTEFMSPTESGEDFVVHCAACGYAANIEKAVSVPAAAAEATGPGEVEHFATPDVHSIDDLASAFGIPADQQIKTLVYVLDDQLTIILLRGDHQLSEQKLLDLTGTLAARPAHADEVAAALGAAPGSLGAVGVTGVPVLADEVLRGRAHLVTGANRDGYHLRGVDIARDIVVDRWADLREAADGEGCVRCGQPLGLLKAVEVGHIFKLGRRYTELLDATVLDAEGQRVPIVMGSYGIGVERALAAIVEAHHDEKGIVWPRVVAPFEICIVMTAMNDPEVVKTGERLYEELLEAGVDVILDDRDERAGVKFSDAELVGFPLRITVGKRRLADGEVEITERASGDTRAVKLADVLAAVTA